MDLGERTDQVFSWFNNATGQITSSSCTGMCAAVEDDDSVGLQNCTGASTWTVVPLDGAVVRSGGQPSVEMGPMS